MNVHIYSAPHKNENLWYWFENRLWRIYATWWVGLGLWGRCVSYAGENCVSYARQTHFLSYIHQSAFLHIPRVFVFISCTIYTRFHETGLAVLSSSVHQRILKKIYHSFHKNIKQHNRFVNWIIDNKTIFLIKSRSCDTEVMAAENSALHHRNKLHFKIYSNELF